MKAIVFKHDNDGTYVLDREGSFSFVTGYTTQSVGAEIEITSQPSSYLKKISSIAACLILVLSLGLFIRLWTQTNHFVYVDINPSIELQFNRFDRLKAVTPLNDDGAALLGNMDLRGASDKIVLDIINEAIEQGFLVPAGSKTEVLITVIPAGSGLPDTRISAINLTLERNGMNGFTVVETTGMDLKDRAEELGVSPGRLMMAEAAVQASGGMTPLEDLLSKRIDELFDAIEDANSEQSGPSAGYHAAPTEYSEYDPDTLQSPDSSGPEGRSMSPERADIPFSTGAGPVGSPDRSRRNTHSGNPPATGSQANDPSPSEPAASEPQPNPNSGSGNNSGKDPCNAKNPCGKPDCNKCNNGNGNSGNNGNNPCNANNPCGKPDCNRCNNGNGNSGNNPCNANNPCGKSDCNRCNNGNGNSGNNPCNANNPCGKSDCNKCNKGNNGNNGTSPCNANNPCGEPDCNSCNNSKGGSS